MKPWLKLKRLFALHTQKEKREGLAEEISDGIGSIKRESGLEIFIQRYIKYKKDPRKKKNETKTGENGEYKGIRKRERE